MNDNINDNDPLAALRQELASVSISPGFAERVKAAVADDLAPLREELAGLAASPEFAVRVRQRVEQERGRSGFTWLFNWRWAVPVAAAAVIALALAWNVVSRSAAPQVDQVIARVDPPARKMIPEPSPTAPQPETTIARPFRGADERGMVQPPTPPVATDPMLEFITDQPALLRAWMARLEADGAAAAASVSAMPESMREIVIAPIEVNPVVVKWLVEPASLPGALPIILRITADTAERSAK